MIHSQTAFQQPKPGFARSTNSLPLSFRPPADFPGAQSRGKRATSEIDFDTWSERVRSSFGETAFLVVNRRNKKSRFQIKRPEHERIMILGTGKDVLRAMKDGRNNLVRFRMQEKMRAQMKAAWDLGTSHRESEPEFDLILSETIEYLGGHQRANLAARQCLCLARAQGYQSRWAPAVWKRGTDSDEAALARQRKQFDQALGILTTYALRALGIGRCTGIRFEDISCIGACHEPHQN